jgi:hypothetical protein
VSLLLSWIFALQDLPFPVTVVWLLISRAQLPLKG